MNNNNNRQALLFEISNLLKRKKKKQITTFALNTLTGKRILLEESKCYLPDDIEIEIVYNEFSHYVCANIIASFRLQMTFCEN